MVNFFFEFNVLFTYPNLFQDKQLVSGMNSSTPTGSQVKVRVHLPDSSEEGSEESPTKIPTKVNTLTVRSFIPTRLTWRVSILLF